MEAKRLDDLADRITSGLLGSSMKAVRIDTSQVRDKSGPKFKQQLPALQKKLDKLAARGFTVTDAKISGHEGRYRATASVTRPSAPRTERWFNDGRGWKNA